MLCKYGCGQEGRFEVAGGFCCSENWQACPVQRDKRRKTPWHAGKSWSKENRKKISDGLRRNGNQRPNASTAEKEMEKRRKLREIAVSRGYGGYIKGSGRGKGQWYDSKFAGRVYLDSSYEIAYAQYLDDACVNWRRNKNKFPYEWEGKETYYIPDFWLVDTNEYIEIKGYVTDRDRAKWMSFPYPLKIMLRADLKALGLNVR
jgi:hypothetical protein